MVIIPCRPPTHHPPPSPLIPTAFFLSLPFLKKKKFFDYSTYIGTFAGFAAWAAKFSLHMVAPPKSLSREMGIHPSISATGCTACGTGAAGAPSKFCLRLGSCACAPSTGLPRICPPTLAPPPAARAFLIANAASEKPKAGTGWGRGRVFF